MGRGALAGHFDVLVVGAGAAGCVVASRLSEDPARSVCLLEAGPDYGRFVSGRWPEDLLDPDEFPWSHDWGIEGGQPSVRARVIGGCTAHNCCYLSVGAPGDYDEWEALGNPGWSWTTMRPLLARAESMLPVCRPDLVDGHPWKQAVVAACTATGIELLGDFNDPQRPRGVGSVPRNAREGVRWNAAFAYLDPVRGRPNLEIRADAHVDRIELRAQAAEAVVVRSANEELRLNADLIVLAAGAYGSPALLLRSGIGAEEPLRALSIQLRHTLPGVGQGLSDHGGVLMSFGRTDRLLTETEGWAACMQPPQPIVVVKAASTACPSDSWDLHVTALVSSTDFWGREPPERCRAMISVFLMKPVSRGAVSLRTPDPADPPRVDHGFFSDAAGEDLRALADGCAIARDLASQKATAPFVYGDKVMRLLELDKTDLAAQLSHEPLGYWHPTGTCRMGPGEDATAVVDATGRVHGIDNLLVADASILPTIPRANPALTVLAVAEKIAEDLSAA